MGTDIHAIAQVKKGDTWETVKNNPNKWFGKYDNEPEFTALLNFERNYDSFSILADIRNGRGFAGVLTGEPLDVIAEPRGFPEDFTSDKDDPDMHEGVWLGDHSHSYVTLAELLAVDWAKERQKTGWINGIERRKMRAEGLTAPNEWCGGVSGPDVQHVSLSELDRKLDILDDIRRVNESDSDPSKDYPHVYAEITWGVTYAESAWALSQTVIPYLRTLGEPENVRMVFGFDS